MYDIDQRKDKMIELYLSGLSHKKAAEQVGYSQTMCRNELKRRNITNRSIHSSRKYSVNEQFFDIIDTEDKAYWLGFLTADGCITNRSIRLALHPKDKNHIEKFLISINSNHPIKYKTHIDSNRKFKICHTNISSIKLSKAIQHLGVIQNKTFIVKPCDQIPQNLIRHYWRGIIDGDGSLGYYSNKWQIQLVGSKFIIQGFFNWINTFTKTKAKILPQNNIYYIKCSGNNLAVNIIKTLYLDTNIFLDRKMKLANQAIGVFR